MSIQLSVGGMPKRPTGVVLQPNGTFRVWIPGGPGRGKKWLPGSFPLLAEAVFARQTAIEDRKGLREGVVTLKGAIEVVEADYKANGQEGTLGWFKAQARVILRILDGGTPVRLLAVDDMLRLRDTQLAEGVSKASVQHRKRALSIVCNEMVRRGEMGKNPVRLIKWPKADSKPFDWVPAKVLGPLLKKIPMPDRAVIELAFQTGLRRSELSRLAEDHVSDGRLVVRGKARIERHPLSKRAQALLKDFPFGISVDQIDRIFKRWKKELQEPRLYPHAMRHSYAMALRDAGHDIYEVSRLMRHRSIEMTKVYFHDEGLTLKDDLLE